MTDFEALGAFYLGKRYDLASRTRRDDYVLYDAKDLTTHAVIIGMTGSGKTGLGIGLLEEALIDKVPVIAVDPKGDLGNLALRFPSLTATDFRPWIDPQQASNAGVSPDDFAQKQATLWRDGLAGWGQDGARIQHLIDAHNVVAARSHAVLASSHGHRRGRALGALHHALLVLVRDKVISAHARAAAALTSESAAHHLDRVRAFDRAGGAETIEVGAGGTANPVPSRASAVRINRSRRDSVPAAAGTRAERPIQRSRRRRHRAAPHLPRFPCP